MAAFSTAAAAVATVASAAIGASSASKAAKQSAAAVTDASAAATALDKEIYYDQRGLLEPSIAAGADARAKQMLMTGSTPEQVRAYLAQTRSALAGGSGSTSSLTDLQARYPDQYAAWQQSGGGQNGALITSIFGNQGNNQRQTFDQYLTANGLDINPVAQAADDSWIDDWDAEEWLRSTPGYEFNFSEGQRGLERGAAARGDLYSGGFARELTRYGQNYADSEWDDLYDQFGQLAGDGAQSTGQVINVAGQYGNNATGNMMAAGNARASAYQQSGAAWGDFWNNTVPGGIGVITGYGNKGGWG